MPTIATQLTPDEANALFECPAIAVNNVALTVNTFGARLTFLEETSNGSGKFVRCAVMLPHEVAVSLAEGITNTLKGGQYGSVSGNRN